MSNQKIIGKSHLKHLNQGENHLIEEQEKEANLISYN